MQRKLTAILSADVVGYSGMMEADEAGTLERLKANRTRIFDPHLAIHEGRLFKLMGDGALVEFSSVVAAVNCALAIQEAVHEYGVTLRSWDELPTSHALVAAVAHRCFKDRATSEYVAKMAKSAPFIDVKCAFDADAIRQAGATVWRL